MCVLSANFLVTFTGLAVTFAVMLATHSDIPHIAGFVFFLIFEIGLFLNPVLIYTLDAKMRITVNEMFGVKSRIEKKRGDQIIKLTERLAPVPAQSAINVQVNAPTSPADLDTQKSPTEIKTVLMARN